ncbi:MAG: hypothetical protein WD556_13325 [Actinomycetota bacterium]
MRMHARIVITSAVALAIGLVAVTQAPAGPAVVDPVKVNPDVWEDFPAAADAGMNSLIAWTADGKSTPDRFNAFLQVNGGPRIKVNPEKTRGYTGAFASGTDRLVWQQVKKGQSDLRFYDASAGAGVPLGRSDVNTSLWQWRPSIDGDHLLYGENRFDAPDAPWKVVLADLGDPNQTKRVLATAKNRCRCLYPGQISGNYATWTKCSPVCQVFVHQIDTATTTRVTNEPQKQQYFGVPNENGVSYLVRSGNACGANAQIVAVPLGSESRQLVHVLDDGKDVNDISTVPGSSFPEPVYFSRFGCGNAGQANIYSTDVLPPTRIAPDVGRSITGRKRLPLPTGSGP